MGRKSGHGPKQCGLQHFPLREPGPFPAEKSRHLALSGLLVFKITSHIKPFFNTNKSQSIII